MNPSLALIFHRDDSIFAKPTTAPVEIVDHRPRYREWKSWLVWTSKDFSSNDCPRKTDFDSVAFAWKRDLCNDTRSVWQRRYHFVTLLFAREKQRFDEERRLGGNKLQDMPREERKERKKKEARNLFSSSRGRKEGRIKDEENRDPSWKEKKNIDGYTRERRKRRKIIGEVDGEWAI